MRIPVEKKKDDLESWLHQLQKQISELKPDNEEVQAKLKELQVSLDQAIKNQVKQGSQQIQCQKQIALLRSQIEEASNAKNIQPIEEKLKTLEADLTQLKSNLPTDIITHLKTLQDEYLSLKKSTEQVAKFNSGLRAQLQSVIEESARQADQFTRWQNEFTEQLAQQNKQQDAVLSELQAQLSQTKMALNKRLAALEGRVGNLEIKHTVLEAKHDAFVAKTDPTYTVVQKLLKLRQVVLEDKYISEELKYYVAPNGESHPGLGDHEALYEWTQKNLLDTKAEARVLLLQGQGGAGKSTFNRFLLRELWQDKAWENFKPGQPMPNAYIPIFIPLGSTQVDPKKLFSYFLDLPELVEDFTESEINVLKKDYKLLLIVDGYDEMPGSPALNLYDVNQLHQYEGRVKLLVSCRSQRSQELNEATYFVPHEHGKPQDSFYKRRSVSPFDDKQMASYIEKYLAKNKTRTDITLWPDVTTYQKHIESLPDLRKLIDTPFLLMITVEVLPQIVAEVEKESKAGKESKITDSNQLTRAKLYDRFVANWFERQARKALEANELPEQAEIKKFYQQFCLKLAECFRTAQITSIQYPWEEEIDLFADAKEDKNDPKGPRGAWVKQLFGDKNSQIASARKGAPLRVGAKNYHQFIHASLIDYFLTTAIHQQTKTREAVVKTEVKNTIVQEPASTTTHVVAPTSPTVKGLPLNTPVTTPMPPKTPILSPALPTPIIQKSIETISRPAPKPLVKKLEIVLPELAISSAETLLLQQKLSQEQVYFLADRVKEDEAFKKYLFSLIERSKKEADMAIASANAITVLNSAQVSFSGMDLKGIRISGADLTQAVLDSTQLQGADLSEVTLTGAWLRQTNFSQCQMRGVKFGEWPSLILPGKAVACAYSPDGQWLAAADEENIYLYDAKSNALQRTLKGKGKVQHGSIVFDAQGKHLASINDRKVHLWQIATGRLQRTFSEQFVRAESLAFDNKGGRLAMGTTGGGKVYLWQVATGLLERIFEGHRNTESVMSVAFDAKGERLASGSMDGSVCLWEVATGRLEHNFGNLLLGWIESIAFDGQGKLLAVGGMEGGLQLWQVATKRLERTLVGHTGSVWSIAFDERGERLASGSSDKTVRLWQVATGQPERTLEGHAGEVLSIAFSKNDCLASVGGSDKSVRLWQIGTRLPGRTYKGHARSINSIVFDAQSKCVASGGSSWDKGNKIICLWKVATGQLERMFEGGQVLSFDAQGERLLSLWDGSICLWHVATGRLECKLTHWAVNSAVFDSREEYLTSFGRDDVRLWRVRTGELVNTFRKNESKEYSPKEYSPAEGYSLVCHDIRGDRRVFVKEISDMDVFHVCIWQKTTGRLERHNIPKREKGWPRFVFDGRGERLAFVGGDNSICLLWQAEKGWLQRKFNKEQGHTEYVSTLAFDPKGEYLATGSYDKTVRLWQVLTGVCQVVIKGFNDSVNCLSWQQTPLGNLLVTGSADKAVRCWQVKEEKGDKDKLHVMLLWASYQSALTAIDACIDGVLGLDTANRDLLQQRGAKGTPAEFKSLESQKASSSPAKKDKDPADIRGMAAPAARLGLLAAPSESPISTSVSVDAKAIAEPKTL